MIRQLLYDKGLTDSPDGTVLSSSDQRASHHLPGLCRSPVYFRGRRIIADKNITFHRHPHIRGISFSFGLYLEFCHRVRNTQLYGKIFSSFLVTMSSKIRHH